MNFNLQVFNLINQFAGKNYFLDGLAVFFAEYLQYFIFAAVVIFLLVNFRKNLQAVISAGVSVFFSRIVITEIIRNIFFRSRPFVENQAILLINQSPEEASFPSGHATLFFALAIAIYFYNKKFGIAIFISSILISLSRVFVGVHWPSDIFFGAIIGIISGWLVVKIFRNFFQRFSEKIFLFLPIKKKPQ
jgi:undecaprenyl-diphosphatase